jgi:hypothetical protein
MKSKFDQDCDDLHNKVIDQARESIKYIKIPSEPDQYWCMPYREKIRTKHFLMKEYFLNTLKTAREEYR